MREHSPLRGARSSDDKRGAQAVCRSFGFCLRRSLVSGSDRNCLIPALLWAWRSVWALRPGANDGHPEQSSSASIESLQIGEQVGRSQSGVPKSEHKASGHL